MATPLPVTSDIEAFLAAADNAAAMTALGAISGAQATATFVAGHGTSNPGEVLVSDDTNARTAASTGVLFSALVASIPAADTGWTANDNAGDKTVAVPNYTGGGALAGVDAAADAALVALCAKVAALETALVAKLLPNA